MTRDKTIQIVELEREFIERKIKELIEKIGVIPIANKQIMPFGWRKAAKGRTVWRIVEEVISQNLEKYANDLGFEDIKPASSEVGVYDFEFILENHSKSFVNIKSSVIDGKRNKDDISKGEGLIQFFSENPDSNLYVATFLIAFNSDMQIELKDCIVFPVSWIPDVYINPSNNANLQSADYKKIEKAEKRTNEEFFEVLKREMVIAEEKRKKKKNKVE
ncbi:hypothetical protein [Neobacillus sp. PS3-40]|uniref:hypothetical protein n=1 Tax=Neobacillus sp. PS3-40 TaxID=3070679 RepID=UPI0027DFF00E|nr:hypothetical protein [Neobacillus sp. PS3-40]WML42408.1 hypothetical protein RCG20_10930 [Neobacillus sp. PS3-40]